MGVFIAISPCQFCGRVFAYDPDKVPSFEERPICESCIEEINEGVRSGKVQGPEFVPQPGAYHHPVEADATAERRATDLDQVETWLDGHS